MQLSGVELFQSAGTTPTLFLALKYGEGAFSPRETESFWRIFEDYFENIRARNEWIMNKNNQGRKFYATAEA